MKCLVTVVMIVLAAGCATTAPQPYSAECEAHRSPGCAKGPEPAPHPPVHPSGLGVYVDTPP